MTAPKNPDMRSMLGDVAVHAARAGVEALWRLGSKSWAEHEARKTAKAPPGAPPTSDDVQMARTLLGVSDNADLAACTRAYRELAARWHPDKAVGKRMEAKHDQQTRALNAAIGVLRKALRPTP